jgi:type II secretory pathway component PulC
MGDILLALGGTPLTHVESLMNALRYPLKGDSLQFAILRAGEAMSIESGFTVRVGKRN